MRKTMNKRALLLTLAFSLLIGCAHAETSYTGTVIAGDLHTVLAPFGGTVESIAVREGEWVEMGDEVATISVTKHFAPCDGTVRGLFAAEGQSASGTVMYLAPVSKYTITASVSEAYSSVDTTYVVIGETVYISCTTDGSHRAVGVITAVNGTSFTVQTTRGELYMEERVNLYRTSDYESTSRIGRGAVARTEELTIRASGIITRMCVADGEEVERGQLLFETVDASIETEAVPSSTVAASASGVVTSITAKAGATVQADGVLMEIAEPSQFQVSFNVPESALASVSEGDLVSLEFLQNEEVPRVYTGVIASIAYVGEAGESETEYPVLVSFQADESVRLGMTVTVTFDD